MMCYLNLFQINNSSTLPRTRTGPYAPVAPIRKYGFGTGVYNTSPLGLVDAPVAPIRKYGFGTGVYNTSPLGLVDAPVAQSDGNIAFFGTGEEDMARKRHIMPQ